MKRYRVYQIDAFTKNRFEGNPAGVVSNANGLTESQMLAIARELNNSETAFIFSPTESDHEVWIRFFTPTVEVPTCGHATISAHFVRAMEKKLSSCTVHQRIGIGVLPVDVIKEKSKYRIIMTQGKFDTSTAVYFVYEKGLTTGFEVGYASAAAYVLFAIIAVASLFLFASMRRRAPLW